MRSANTGFTFGEVVTILTKLFAVADAKRDTFVSRLQQLQKAGIPGGANSGRGVKVRYENWQLADFVLALDLIDLGLTPAMLANNPAASAYGIGGYGYHVEASLADDRPDLFWLIRANALAYLTSASDGTTKADPRDTLLFGRSASNAIEELAEGPAIVINMTGRLRALRDAVQAVYPDMIEQLTFYPTRSGQKEG